MGHKTSPITTTVCMVIPNRSIWNSGQFRGLGLNVDVLTATYITYSVHERLVVKYTSRPHPLKQNPTPIAVVSIARDPHRSPSSIGAPIIGGSTMYAHMYKKRSVSATHSPPKSQLSSEYRVSSQHGGIGCCVVSK